MNTARAGRRSFCDSLWLRDVVEEDVGRRHNSSILLEIILCRVCIVNLIDRGPDCIAPKHLVEMDFSAKMWKDIPSLVKYHHKNNNMNYPMGIYITLVHVLGIVGLTKVMECSRETLMWAFILWPIR